MDALHELLEAYLGMVADLLAANEAKTNGDLRGACAVALVEFHVAPSIVR